MLLGRPVVMYRKLTELRRVGRSPPHRDFRFRERENDGFAVDITACHSMLQALGQRSTDRSRQMRVIATQSWRSCWL
jgi:hypothetical protein